jgi:hypothetical protein
VFLQSFNEAADSFDYVPLFWGQWSTDLQTLKIADMPLTDAGRISDNIDVPRCWHALISKENLTPPPPPANRIAASSTIKVVLNSMTAQVPDGGGGVDIDQPVVSVASPVITDSGLERGSDIEKDHQKDKSKTGTPAAPTSKNTITIVIASLAVVMLLLLGGGACMFVRSKRLVKSNQYGDMNNSRLQPSVSSKSQPPSSSQHNFTKVEVIQMDHIKGVGSAPNDEAMSITLNGESALMTPQPPSQMTLALNGQQLPSGSNKQQHHRQVSSASIQQHQRQLSQMSNAGGNKKHQRQTSSASNGGQQTLNIVQHTVNPVRTSLQQDPEEKKKFAQFSNKQ